MSPETTPAVDRLKATMQTGTPVEIVDAQVHVNSLGLDAGLAAMNAVGIQSVIIDEWWGFDETGARMPSYRLPNGAVRHEYPFAIEASTKYPDRFAYMVWVDRRDPDLNSIVAAVRDNPRQLCLRVVIQPEIGEDVAFAEGAYDPVFAAATRHDVPVMLLLPRVTPFERRIAITEQQVGRHSDVQIILDHCAVLPLTDAEFSQHGKPESLEHLLRMARFPHVAVKWASAPLLSQQRFPFADVTSYLRRAVDVFTPERIMWASDHTRTSSHFTWAEALNYIAYTDELEDSEKVSILGQTARALLRWPSGENA